MVQVLNGIDPDPAAQEMMLEQFVAEVPMPRRGICELEGLSSQVVGLHELESFRVGLIAEVGLTCH